MPETDPKRADYEPYFEMWDSVMFYPNLASGVKQEIYGHTGEAGMMPCYQHQTCGAMVKLGAFNLGKYPPRVCPGCKVDTAKEIAKKIEDNEEKRIEVPHGFSTS